MKLKQKEVTMWAIWSPYSKKILKHTVTSRRIDSWAEAWNYDSRSMSYKENYNSLKKEGYRAVKGKFVWEEK